MKIGSAPKGSKLTVPPLLATVGKYIAKLEHGDLGWFDSFAVEAIPSSWDPANAKRLRENGFVFLSLPEGSLLALLDAGGTVPSVVLLGSEGDRRTVADSFEEFLALWAKGELDISELDDEEAEDGRKALGAWLKKQKLEAPKATSVDFQAWLDGAAPPASAKAKMPPAKKAIARKPTAIVAKLGPKVKELVAIVGTRADDPATVRYIEKTLKKKAPKLTSERNDDASIDASRLGIQLGIGHQVLNDDYPPISVTKSSFVPYVHTAWIDAAIKESVLDLDWDAPKADAITKVLGKPAGIRPEFMDESKPTVPWWQFVLDAAAHVVLNIDYADDLSVRIEIAQALELEKYDRVNAGLFIGWAATRKLLDTKRLSAYADLVAKIAKRQAQGTALWDAFGRGLWDDFLVDRGDLRRFAYQWFNNLGKVWIVKDLIKVFGKRMGPEGHHEPKLDDDTWEAVAKATKMLDERFKPFLK